MYFILIRVFCQNCIFFYFDDKRIMPFQYRLITSLLYYYDCYGYYDYDGYYYDYNYDYCY